MYSKKEITSLLNHLLFGICLLDPSIVPYLAQFQAPQHLSCSLLATISFIEDGAFGVFFMAQGIINILDL